MASLKYFRANIRPTSVFCNNADYNQYDKHPLYTGVLQLVVGLFLVFILFIYLLTFQIQTAGVIPPRTKTEASADGEQQPWECRCGA